MPAYMPPAGACRPVLADWPLARELAAGPLDIEPSCLPAAVRCNLISVPHLVDGRDDQV